VLGLAWLFLSLPTSASEVAVPLEIKEAPPSAPTPRPVPTSSVSVSPAFDFTAYTKKLREADASNAASASSDKTAKPNAPVVVGLGGINSPASHVGNMPLTS
jgi:hypothetical protein